MTPPLTVLARDSRALAPTVRETWIAAEPASTSLTARPVSTRLLSSASERLPESVLTGASFTALTVTVMLSVSVSVPPAPVLPRSLSVTVTVSTPFASVFG